MAKIALVLFFSSMLLLSIQPTVGEDEVDDGNQNTSEFSDATGERLANSLEKAEDSPGPSFPRAFGPSRLVPLDEGVADSDSTGGQETTIDEGGLIPPSSPRPFGPGSPTLIDNGGLTSEDLAPETTIDEGGLNPQDLAPETGTTIDEGGLIPQDIAPGMSADEGGPVPQDLAPGMLIDQGGLVADMPSGEGGTEADSPEAEVASAPEN